ncbi:ATP-dependent helicase [Kineococcus sp. R86509]|uniref:ATP-dependent helicase n=1 Tax=Kineococcus sp. R86509 TaxID=3093851 RepID=UPI0036D3BC0A
MKFKFKPTGSAPSVPPPAPFTVRAERPSTQPVPAAGTTRPSSTYPDETVRSLATPTLIGVAPGPALPSHERKAPLVADIPRLEGDAAKAVAHRGSHIQIIAAAGSGKTEVVSQRVASLLADGEPPESIVAFTFTEKAASELKERIRERVTALEGPDASDQLGRLFVGTIHAYCFRLLQTYVPKYETYTPLDENQLTNLLYRENYLLGLKKIDANQRTFAGIRKFQRGVDVIENELIDLAGLPDDDFKAAVVEYYAMLDRYQFMSFGTQIVRAVEALADPAVHAAVTAALKHLIVDEYQDVNPAQERLIELLAKPKGSADVVVVGDDDQAIYQWRGSAVENIVTFDQRHPSVARFKLLTNRRSRPGIVELANLFAGTIPGRIDKVMNPFRPAQGPSVGFTHHPGTEDDDAATIAEKIADLRAGGVQYRDVAILVRGRAAYPAIMRALDAAGIPVQPGGRTGLFVQPEAEVFAATYAWIADVDWSADTYAGREVVRLERLLDSYSAVFELSEGQRAKLVEHLPAWKGKALASTFNESLVGDFYDLVGMLGVKTWDLSSALVRNRLGTVARFTNVLADYEGVSWRSRRDPNAPGEQVGARSGGEWFYRNFAILLANYANGSYDDFAGEEDLVADGVALGTVHGSKGLEWPVVFLPSLVTTRFPSSKIGHAQDWPTSLLGRFDRTRYEGTDADERRLFYVAITRARDAVFLSAYSRFAGGKVRRVSRYLDYVMTEFTQHGEPVKISGKQVGGAKELAVTYSELAAFESCPRGYLLKSELGFMPTIQPELGYGNAVHHTMRVIAERTKATGEPPTVAQIDALLNSEFFLPYANKAGHKEMREKAQRLVQRYVRDHSSELLRTWATERPFELYLDGAVVSGRADVIYDEHDGQIGSLAIVDYKTSISDEPDPLQLQIYAEAGKREGLDVVGAFVDDMGTTVRYQVAVDPAALSHAEASVIATVDSLRRRQFEPRPEKAKCRACDVRRVCNAAATR